MSQLLELNKAREVYGILQSNLTLISRLKISSALKENIVTDLNRCMQFLNFKNLRVFEEKDLEEAKHVTQGEVIHG